MHVLSCLWQVVRIKDSCCATLIQLTDATVLISENHGKECPNAINLSMNPLFLLSIMKL